MLNYLYEPMLMTGILDSEGTIADGTLYPIVNQFVVICNGQMCDVLKTDGKGALCNVAAGDGKHKILVPFQSKKEKIEEKFASATIYIIPESIVQDSWFFDNGTESAGNGKPWIGFIRKWIKSLDSNAENRIKPIVKRFRKQHLEKTSEKSSEAYVKFCNTIKDNDYPCILIPRARLIVCNLGVIKTIDDDNTEIGIEILIPYKGGVGRRIIAMEKETIHDSTEPPFYMGMLVSHKKILPEGETTLPEGPYTFTIPPSALNQQIPWSAEVLKNGLAISAQVKFNIRTVNMEIAVVNLDPISLEDSILMQFPGRYSRTIGKVIEASSGDPEIEGLLKVLGDWKNKVAWMQGQHKQAGCMMKPGDFYSKFRLMVNFGIKHGQESCFPDWFLDAFKLGTGGVDYINQYRSFMEKEDNLKVIIKGLDKLNAVTLKEAASVKLASVLQKVTVESDFYKSFAPAVNIAAGEELKIVALPKDIAESSDFISKAEKFEKGFETAAAGVDVALNAIELSTKLYEKFCTFKNASQRRDDLKKLVGDYVSLFTSGVSRDAFSVLERYRQALIASRVSDDKATYEALYAGVNLALAAASMVPGLQFPAGVIVLAKDGIKGSIELYKKITGALDHHLLKNWFAVQKEAAKRLETIKKDSHYGCEEISKITDEEAVDNVLRQLHVRAEVISGLVEIVERCGSKVENGSFDASVLQKYRLSDYINFFILGKGGDWNYPKQRTFPLSLGTLWHYYTSMASSDKYKNLNDVYKLNAYEQKAADLGDFPLASYYGPSSRYGDNAFKVTFNNRFPVHYVSSGMASDSLKEFAKVFSVNYTKVQPDFIETVLVYYREKPQEQWRPLWEKNLNGSSSIPAVTPLTQIRICVICKKQSAGDAKNSFYPLSVQLFRMGYLNLDNYGGPLYKKNTSILTPGGDFGLLTEGPGAEYEIPYHKEKRHGAIIYPFYTYAGAQFCGLKPFQKDVFLSAEKTHPIRIVASIEGTRAQRYFYPPTEAGKAPENKKAEITLYVNTTNSTIGQSKKELELQVIMLSDLSFIKNRSSNGTSQPVLVKPGRTCEIAGSFFKIKKEWKYFSETKRVIKAGLGDQDGIDFNWSEPFEMVTIFAVNEINSELKNSREYDWRKPPLQMQWVQKIDGSLDVLNLVGVDVNDIKGPKYSTSFYYLGYNIGCQGNLGNLKAGLNWNEKDGLEEDLVAHHSDIGSLQIQDVLKNHLLKQSDLLKTPKCGNAFIFAGHYRFNYEIPGSSVTVDALRPFGKVKKGDVSLRYTFSLTDESNGKGTRNSEIQIEFPSPYIANLPRAWGNKKIDENFMDMRKVGSAYLSLTNEIVRMVGRGK